MRGERREGTERRQARLKLRRVGRVRRHLHDCGSPARKGVITEHIGRLFRLRMARHFAVSVLFRFLLAVDDPGNNVLLGGSVDGDCSAGFDRGEFAVRTDDADRSVITDDDGHFNGRAVGKFHGDDVFTRREGAGQRMRRAVGSPRVEDLAGLGIGDRNGAADDGFPGLGVGDKDADRLFGEHRRIGHILCHRRDCGLPFLKLVRLACACCLGRFGMRRGFAILVGFGLGLAVDHPSHRVGAGLMLDEQIAAAVGIAIVFYSAVCIDPEGLIRGCIAACRRFGFLNGDSAVGNSWQ